MWQSWKKHFCMRFIHEHCSYSQSVRKFYLESGKIDILKKIETIVHSWLIPLKAGKNNWGHCDLNDIFPLHIYLVRETLFFKGKVREFWKVIAVETMSKRHNLFELIISSRRLSNPCTWIDPVLMLFVSASASVTLW